jgi:photosystem II CP43 chlorophyll apoprotein
MVLWAGGAALFELSRFAPEKPLYGQGAILVPHLAVLLPAGGPPGAGASLAFRAFAAAVLHLLSGGALALGGCFHAALARERLASAAGAAPFAFSWRDRFRTSSVLGAHLLFLGAGALLLVLGSLRPGAYDTWAAGGGELRVLKEDSLTLNLWVLGPLLARAPFGGEGFIVSVASVEDVGGGHFWLAFPLAAGALWHLQTSPFSAFSRSFLWAGEGFLSYSLSALSLAGFAAAVFSWYNTTAYPSEFLGPTAAEASQAQSFTFLARDQRLGAGAGAAQGPTSLGKYLMRSPAGEVVPGGETMRFWTTQAAWAEPLRASYGLEPLKLQRDLEPWQERRAGELVVHAPLGSLNSVGGVATEVNAVNFASPRSWLTCSHWLLSFFALVGHWWHAGRARAAALGAERGVARRFEQVLFVRAID